MADLLAAAVLNGAGIAALYTAWRGSVRAKRTAVSAGWLLIFAAAIFWCRYAGVEFGLVYVSLFTPAAAWVAVVVNRESRRGKRRDRTAMQNVVPDRAAVSRHLLRFVVAVPLAAVASVFVGVAAVSGLSWEAVDAAALAVLGIPFLWGLATYWACADPRLRRPALGLSAAGAAAAVLVLAG